MKEKIFKNFSLKILSVVCAVVLWTVIVNIYDPTTSVTVSNVNVQLVNTESLTDKGYTYEVVDGSKISVYLSGPKSVITDIKSSDIVATADLSQITAFADYVDIDVKVVKDGRTISNIEVAPRTTVVRLNIENRVTKEFKVYPDTTGTAANGYTILSKSVSPDNIRVTGPTSSIENVATVKAVADVTGASSNIRTTAQIVLYDADGNVIQDDKLQLSVNEVDFSATVGSVKTIPVTCLGTTGTVASGYSVTGIELGVTEVAISSENSELLERTNSIVIPESAIDITNCRSDYTISIKLSDYVENGIKFISIDSTEVVVKIEPLSTRTLSCSVDKISFTGLGTGLHAEIIETSEVPVVISGNRNTISSVSSSDITISCNLSDYSEGEHTVKLTVTGKSGYSIVGEYSCKIRITSENESESSTE